MQYRLISFRSYNRQNLISSGVPGEIRTQGSHDYAATEQITRVIRVGTLIARKINLLQSVSTDWNQSEPFEGEPIPQFLNSIAYPQREQPLSCLT